MTNARRLLVRLLLGFWSAWFGLVTLTNVTDGLKTTGFLPETWRLASGNYGLMLNVTSIYDIPHALVAAMFVGIIVWELLAAVLFGLACFKLGRSGETAAVDRAVVTGVALFAAFVLADEVFIAFPTGIEGTHLRILVAQLATWLVLRHASVDG